MRTVHYELSMGEAVDRLIILGFKALRIADSDLSNKALTEKTELFVKVNEELSDIHGEQHVKYMQLYSVLEKINGELWNIEDKLRELESKKDFGEEFIHNARRVYQLNDERSNMKGRINVLFDSRLSEIKSYNSEDGSSE